MGLVSVLRMNPVATAPGSVFAQHSLSGNTYTKLNHSENRSRSCVPNGSDDWKDQI